MNEEEKWLPAPGNYVHYICTYNYTGRSSIIYGEAIPLPPSLAHMQTHKGDPVPFGAEAREQSAVMKLSAFNKQRLFASHRHGLLSCGAAARYRVPLAGRFMR